MSYIHNILIRIWRDSVGSNIMSAILIAVSTYLFAKIPHFEARIDSYLAEKEISYFHLILLVIVFSVLLSLIIYLIRILLSRIRQNRFHIKYLSSSGTKLTIDNISRNSPTMYKISICGIGNVGKTTLIENLCEMPNERAVTVKKEGYVMNFSNNKYKYAALLDGSGQSQATQNDLALLSDILVIMFDHNVDEDKKIVDEERLTKQERFTAGLVDRFKTSGVSPKYIFIIFNKKDLWRDASPDEMNVMKKFMKSQHEIIRRNFGSSVTSLLEFSNEYTQDRLQLKNKLSDAIK